MTFSVTKYTAMQLSFDNRFFTQLPADPDLTNVRRQVTGACYSKVNPTSVIRPELVAYSREMADRIGLSTENCEASWFTEVFAGNKLLPGMEPYAMCYGGHQFGQWAGQLGDGRAINLGEVVNQQGERWVLQLKGAGLTPYSRTADGLAVLRSSVREFLCSEAMFHLGIPTTRALSLVLTGEQVVRDMFYNGNPQSERGAIVCRIAPSFTRFGNFEIFTSRGEMDVLKQLVDFTIRTDFNHLGEPSKEVYLAWFKEVCRSTAEMIVHWQRVGFVHGVMNTDNMSILGLTIDYGPYGWLENYDPDWTPNTTDVSERRYRFGHQPQIALWNLTQLANAIYPLIEEKEALEVALNSYTEHFVAGWQSMMAEKLGFDHFVPENDEALVTELLALLLQIETDMTIFFRKLASINLNETSSQDLEEKLVRHFDDVYYRPEQRTSEYRQRLVQWLQNYRERLDQEGKTDESRLQQMNRVNPKYVLRNYLAQLAIDKADQGDFSMVNELLEVLRRPYDEQPQFEKYAVKRPDWARQRAGCSMLSCSS